MAPRDVDLTAIDAGLDGAGASRLTLDPARTFATRLPTLADRLCHELDPARERALRGGLARTAQAIVDNFPCNIFCDLDGVAASFVREARDASELDAAFDELVALQALFGGGTAIRFRYAHDFLYGFDWAKWVRRDPEARAHVAPFSRAFLRVMLARGEELLGQIAAHDATYPPIAGDTHRNPFGFSREPEDERRLHRALAADGLVPVRAWTTEASARWDLPFANARVERAVVLGIALSAPR